MPASGHHQGMNKCHQLLQRHAITNPERGMSHYDATRHMTLSQLKMLWFGPSVCPPSTSPIHMRKRGSHLPQSKLPSLAPLMTLHPRMPLSPLSSTLRPRGWQGRGRSWAERGGRGGARVVQPPPNLDSASTKHTEGVSDVHDLARMGPKGLLQP